VRLSPNENVSTLDRPSVVADSQVLIMWEVYYAIPLYPLVRNLVFGYISGVSQ
jgi:hypothetical protein